MNDKLERLTLLVPASDIRRIKHIAVDRSVSISSLVRDALHEIVVVNQSGSEK